MSRSLFLLLLLLIPAAAVAREPVLVHTAPPPAVAARAAADCIAGNSELWRLQGYYANFWVGEESYAQLFEPAATSCWCSFGFALVTTHIYLYLEPGADFQVRARLLAVEDPDHDGCRTPGDVLASGLVQQVSGITTAGYYDVAFPSWLPCALLHDSYFLAVDFLGGTGPVGLPVDDQATGCRVFNDTGDGWTDLAEDWSLVGDLFIWGDMLCCGEPVADDRATWGGVKSRFR